jgi:hypothetical protein
MFYDALKEISKLNEGEDVLNYLYDMSWNAYRISKGDDKIYVFKTDIENTDKYNSVLEGFNFNVVSDFVCENFYGYKFYSVKIRIKENGEWVTLKKEQLKELHKETITVQGLDSVDKHFEKE